MKRCFIAGIFLLVVSVPGMALSSPEKLIQEAVGKHLYIIAQELLAGPIDRDLPKEVREKWKATVIGQIEQMRIGSYLERLYVSGYDAWVKSDKIEMKAAWEHFLAAAEQLDSDGSREVIEEIKVHLAPFQAEAARQKKEPITEILSSPSMPMETSTPVPVPIRIRRTAKVSHASKPSPAFNRLLSRAEEERSAGRLESALWLYQQAHRMRPESKEAKESLEGLKNEMELEKKMN